MWSATASGGDASSHSTVNVSGRFQGRPRGRRTEEAASASLWPSQLRPWDQQARGALSERGPKTERERGAEAPCLLLTARGWRKPRPLLFPRPATSSARAQGCEACSQHAAAGAPAARARLSEALHALPPSAPEEPRPVRRELRPPWVKPGDPQSCRLGASQSDSASASARNGGRPPPRARGDEPQAADDKHGLTLAAGSQRCPRAWHEPSSAAVTLGARFPRPLLCPRLKDQRPPTGSGFCNLGRPGRGLLCPPHDRTGAGAAGTGSGRSAPGRPVGAACRSPPPPGASPLARVGFSQHGGLGVYAARTPQSPKYQLPGRLRLGPLQGHPALSVK